MEKHVIIINGAGGVGKDTLINEFASLRLGTVSNISTVFNVKKAAGILGWDYADKSDRNRLALSELKALSDKYWNASIKYVMDKYKDFINCEYHQWMFIHCREPEKIAEIKEHIKDAKAVLIKRDGIEKHGNASDDNVDNYDYDMVFQNNGNDIVKNGGEFTLALFELFNEDTYIPHTRMVSVEGINIIGRTFMDAGEYGLGSFTVLECLKYYEYSKYAETPDGSHWFKCIEIRIRLANGLMRTIPFCPWWNIVDKDGDKTFRQYYDEQPW